MCDNKSAIALAKNLVFHGRSKHIDIKIHYILELIKNGEIELDFCRTAHQIVDFLTKPLKMDSFGEIEGDAWCYRFPKSIFKEGC